jgi:hypothetical protein
VPVKGRSGEHSVETSRSHNLRHVLRRPRVCHAGFSPSHRSDSQAGRRRFDPGRMLPYLLGHGCAAGVRRAYRGRGGRHSTASPTHRVYRTPCAGRPSDPSRRWTVERRQAFALGTHSPGPWESLYATGWGGCDTGTPHLVPHQLDGTRDEEPYAPASGGREAPTGQ